MTSGTSDASVFLRPAVESDLPGISEIERLSFIHAGERFSVKRISYLIRNPRSIVTAAVDGNMALGWASGYAWQRGPTPWGRVYALAVHPRSRGQKLGPRLLEDMIDSLRRQGAGRIFLEVRIDNHAAIRLYERFGFSTCRLLRNYYGHGIDGQRMALAK